MPSLFAHVVVGLPVEGPFDYAVPREWQDKILIGQRVKVSFHTGRRLGVVVGLAQESRIKNLKLLLAILDEIPSLSPTMLQLTKRISGYYGCSWGEAIESSLPKALRGTRIYSPPVGLPTEQVGSAESFFPTLIYDPSYVERWSFLYEKIAQVLSKEKQIIFLVPEGRYIEGIAKRLKEKWEDLLLTILDKKIRPLQELAQWQLIREGAIKIVIGTRSAVFAPCRRLGLIIIWEEQNSSYKQEQSPFYHAREVARWRAEIEHCELVMASAAPSAEIWQQAQQKIIEKIICPPANPANLQMIDLSNYHPRKSSVIFFPLRNVLEKALAKKEKMILLMNRRGFSSVTRCHQCGHTVQCERCNVNLTYLYSKKKMVCRFCNTKKDVPKVCPSCKSTYLRSTGMGIEKLESELARILPVARTARLDRETKNLPKNFDILIATQAVFRFLEDISPDAIAVLQFDALLNRVDFRSAEQAFAMLIFLQQAARQTLLVQTHDTDNYVLQSLRQKNYEAFYEKELKLREELDLPPFKHLVAIGLRGPKEEKVLAQANALYDELMKQQVPGIEICDPHPDVLPKLRDKYRFTILLKGPSVEGMLSLTKAVLADLKRKKNVVITVNVDT